MSAADINKPVAVPERVRIVMSMIRSAAECGAPCPTNQDIADRLGAASMSAGANAIALLESMGLISVARYHHNRVVTIVATGKSTAAPARLVPHWRSGARLKPRTPQAPRPKRTEHLAPAEPESIPPAVFRDPCPRCGIRQDVGCHHSGAPVGMGAF